MKKTLPILLLLILSDASAQNSLWISSGYNYSIARNPNLVDMNPGDARKYSLGNGTSTQLYFQHQPDSSNWTISTGINLLIGNRNITSLHENKGDSVVQSATLTANSLRYFIQLGYAWQVKKFQFQVNAGFNIPLITRLNGDISYRDSFKSTTEKYRVRNFFSVGFKGSASVRYAIQKRIFLFLLTDLQVLNTKVRSKSLYDYHSSDGQTLEKKYPDYADRETIYLKNAENIRNNKAVLPMSFNPGKATESLSYSQSYSSLGLQFGFQFLF